MTQNFHLWLVPVLPLLGFAINGFFGRRFSRKLVATVGLLFVGLAFAMSVWIAFGVAGLPANQIPHIEKLPVPWISAGGFTADFGFYIDQLSLVMMLVVTGVGFLIHVYAVGYMWEEGGYYRFFAYLNLFMFFMLTLVMASNYLLMFVGWEGVGLASYLLIGFYFRRDSAANAGKKAFIVNRVGDFAFLIALFLLIRTFGSLDFNSVFNGVAQGDFPIEHAAGLMTAIALLLTGGAAGKSAQIPLYVWLPDAMEGPTPVSALIHAATMVTAGVYMVARSHVIFDRAPIALTVVAIIGAVTALYAATIGMVQHDIKRVLAYSTISQLGYMFLACGVAAYSAAIFHLMTHAFFKALLFLCAGSVIHGLGGEQDMRKMGGLRTALPWTFMTMTVATLAITGIPGLSGFFSKDEILWQAYSSEHGSWVFWLIGVVTAFLTSFYMFRLWFMTFFGEFRGEVVHGHEAPGREKHAHQGFAHESPWIMLGPLVVLAVLAIFGGYVGVPEFLGGNNGFTRFLAPVFGAAAPEHADSRMEWTLMLVSVAAAAAGLALAWLLYVKRRDLPARITAKLGGLYEAVAHKYYVDELYQAAIVAPLVEGSRAFLWQRVDAGTIDGAVNETADVARDVSDELRRMQSGNLRSYAGWIAAGAALAIAYMVWLGVR